MTLTLEQAAAFLHLHPHTVQERTKAGTIKGAKPGRRWVFIQEDLDEYRRVLEGNETAEDMILRRAIRLPKGPAIYFLLVGKEIVYVGKTRNLTRRIGDHSFRKEFDGFAYLPCSEEILDKSELELIAKFKPRYNRNGRT